MNAVRIIDNVNNAYHRLDNCIILMRERLRRMEGVTDLKKLLEEQDGIEDALNIMEDSVHELSKIKEAC
ncbi:MAG: hypothetical protein NC238_03125 [Dehalobacter sp.]|nr:hypothetical protein [Dehalobacter sp.]